MKKKVLLTLAIMAMIICVFAISVSAAEVIVDEIKYTVTEGATEAENTAVINSHKGTKFTGNLDKYIPEYVEYNGEKYYVTDINYTAFESTNITSMVFDPNCRITVIRSYSFKNCASLKSIVLPSKLQEIRCQSFQGCSILEALYLPDTVRTIGRQENGNVGGKNGNERDGAFFKCPKLYFVNELGATEKPEVWYAPKALEEISGETFKEITTFNNVVVFGENFYQLHRGYSIADKNGSKGRVFIFEGDFTREGAIFQLTCEMKEMDIYFTHPNMQNTNFLSYDSGYRDNTPTAVIHLCASELVYTMAGTQKKGELKLTLVENGANHFVKNENVGVHYDNYFANGYAVNECYCGEKMIASEATLEPVFVSRGISAPEDPSRGACVTQGIKVNREMFALLGDDVDFGIVVDVNVEGNEYNPISNGATTVSLTDSEYDCFDVKVSGIPADYLSTAIVFCFYIEKNEKISYLNFASTLESVTGMSYNALMQIG